jgi:hypothetical protein
VGRRSGGIGLGGILVILGILLAIVWSFWWGLIIGVVGLVFFGGFARESGTKRRAKSQGSLAGAFCESPCQRRSSRRAEAFAEHVSATGRSRRRRRGAGAGSPSGARV